MTTSGSGVLKPNSDPNIAVADVNLVCNDGLAFVKVMCELDLLPRFRPCQASIELYICLPQALIHVLVSGGVIGANQVTHINTFTGLDNITKYTPDDFKAQILNPMGQKAT